MATAGNMILVLSIKGLWRLIPILLLFLCTIPYAVAYTDISQVPLQSLFSSVWKYILDSSLCICVFLFIYLLTTENNDTSSKNQNKSQKQDGSSNKSHLNVCGASHKEIYRDIVEDLIDLYCAFDENKIMRAVSPGLVELLGYQSAEDIIGKPAKDFLIPLSEQNGTYKPQDEIHKNEPYNLVTKHGDSIECIITSRPLYNGCLFAGREGIIQNISALKDALKEIEKQGIVFNAIKDDMQGSFIITDINMNVLAWNQRFENLWNIPPELLEERDLLRIYQHVEALFMYPEKARNAILEAFYSDDLSEHFLITKKDQTIVELYTTPIYDTTGTYYGRLWEFREITDILNHQYDFADPYTENVTKGHTLTRALEDVGEGMWSWDVINNVLSINEGFAENYPEMSSLQFFDEFIALHPDEMESCIHLINDLSRGLARVNIEFEFQTQSLDETWHWIIARGSATKADKNGIPTLFTGTFVDITAHKQYEMSLSEANKKIKILSQITRHDILNQLTVLFSLNDTLFDLVHEPEVVHLVSMSEQSLKTVEHLIQFTRDYQEIGVNGASWQDVNSILSKVNELVIVPAVPPVTLHATNCPHLFADPLLEKVLYNLLENSLRHGEHVTQITVSFSAQEDNSGLLIIEDNGIGVEPSIKNRIFDNGFGKNTGFGLFLVHEILEITQIKICESGEYGHGARFEMHIPPGGWKWEDQYEDGA